MRRRYPTTTIRTLLPTLRNDSLTVHVTQVLLHSSNVFLSINRWRNVPPVNQSAKRLYPIPRHLEKGYGHFKCSYCDATWGSSRACRSLGTVCVEPACPGLLVDLLTATLCYCMYCELVFLRRPTPLPACGGGVYKLPPFLLCMIPFFLWGRCNDWWFQFYAGPLEPVFPFEMSIYHPKKKPLPSLDEDDDATGTKTTHHSTPNWISCTRQHLYY